MNGTDRLELPSDLHSATRAFASAFLLFWFISFLGKEEGLKYNYVYECREWTFGSSQEQGDTN